MLKKILMVMVVVELWSVALAYADIYTKADTMGMGNVETWVSGKKKREEGHVIMPGIPAQNHLTITRVDKDVEWEIDDSLKAYEEKQIHITNKPEKLDPKEEAEAQALSKAMDAPAEAAENICDPNPIVLPKQSIAGFEATGYRSKCPEGTPVTTMWVAPLQGPLAQYEKENTAFQTAYQDLLYKEYTSTTDKIARKMMGMMGMAMSQGLVGVRADKIPKGVALRMEQTGDRGDGVSETHRMVDIQEIRVEKVDPSLFEIPAGYKKVTNLAQLQGEAMARQMGMGDMMEDMKKMNAQIQAETPAAQTQNEEVTQEPEAGQDSGEQQPEITDQSAEPQETPADSNGVVYEG